jgi:hypothetical protein
MTPDMFEIQDRIRGIQAVDHHGTEDKVIRRKIREHLMDNGTLDLAACIQITKEERPDGNRYGAEIAILSGAELRGILRALDEETRKADTLRATLSRVEAERDGLRAFVLEKTLDLDVYISGKGIVQPTHQEFRDRNFVLDHIRADLRAIRAAVKPTTTEGEKP